ncbi:MAG: histidinol-phosphatase HisJ family protein, partial [Spirochaetota bacterium]
MSRYDFHIHGEYSLDSEIAFDECVTRAIGRGYAQIAFSEHFDYLPVDVVEYGMPPYAAYVKRIDALRESYRDSIDILLGAEIGDCHRTGAFVDELFLVRRPDVVIGSVHRLSDGLNVSVPMDQPLDKGRVLDYYRENLALSEMAPVDILGHLGIYKRFYSHIPDESYAAPLVDRILAALIRRGIALEVNYSPMRKTYGRFLPDAGVIRHFLGMGGRLITVGSDAHSIDDF